MHLKSPAFFRGNFIPVKYTCDGENISPPLQWDDPPAETESFALIVSDRDAPTGTFTHWIVYNLPGEMRQLAEGVASQPERLEGKQGQNDFDRVGYGGPCPSDGTHRYFFKLYALDRQLDLNPRASKLQVLAAVEKHRIEAVELMGRYSRQEKQ